MDDSNTHRLTEAILLLTHALECKNDSDWRKSLAELATKQDLEKMEKRIMALLDDVLSDVQDESTVVDGVVTLLNGLSQQLQDAGTDPTKLAAVKTAIDTNKAKLAAAVAANTPAAPSA